jgi:DNA-binding response OmpR family regulator
LLALVAQEDAATTNNIKTILGMCLPECDLLVTPSGAECLRLLKAPRPDVIILDSKLADADGFDILSTIRAGYDGPVLMLVCALGDAIRDEVQTVRAIEMGADYCMKKPFHQLEFIARIRALTRPKLKKDRGSIV